MKGAVEPDSFYLPVFAQKLEYVRPDDEVARLWIIWIQWNFLLYVVGKEI